MTNNKVKELPNNKEIEYALLSDILSSPNIAEDVFIEIEDIEYFYDKIAFQIAKIMLELLTKGETISLLGIKIELENNFPNLLQKIGGLSGLVDIVESVSMSSWESKVEKLKDFYQRREVIKEGEKLINNAFNNNKQLGELIINSYDNINNILSYGQSKASDVENNIKKVEEYIKENTNKGLIGYSWGKELSWLDDITGGIRKGKTYRIGAPSGLGKTNLVYQMIVSLLEQGKKVFFASLENNIETTYIKILSTVQKTNPINIEKGIIKPDLEWLRKYKSKFILIDQLFELNEIKREILKTKPDVVILDYIGLVNISGYDEKSIYNKYADEIKKFVQKHQWLAWVDLSNLNKSDDETLIRMHKGFNGAAKLRNNTDVSIHMFDYKPFNDYKTLVFNEGTEEAKEQMRGKKVVTFYISKNRGGNDNEEKQYLINFNKGIEYKEATVDMLEKWNTLL